MDQRQIDATLDQHIRIPMAVIATVVAAGVHWPRRDAVRDRMQQQGRS